MALGSVLFALIAGVLSTLSPCVLPLVPIILGAAIGEHRLGPAALAGGLAISFTAIGLFVATIGYGIGLDAGAFRLAGALLLIAIGVILLVPQLQTAVAGAAAPLSGWTEQRFGGDAALYGNAELRTFLTDVFIVLPGELGIFALADAGRVFLDGESSDAWHSALGGGLLLAFLDRANTISVAYARSRERGGVYVHLGFMF